MSSSLPARAAIFDMDGLLIDSERGLLQLWREAAARIGHALSDDEYRACIGLAAAEAETVMARQLGGWERLVQVRGHVVARMDTPGAAHFPLRPGAAAVLQAMDRLGIPCAVASSSRHAEIRERLQAVEVLGHFRALAGGDEVPRGKPDPAVYLLAARRLGVDPAHCIAFEDSVNGATAAVAAGLQVVIVPDLLPPTPLLRAQSLAVIPSLDEALARLPAWFGPGRPAPQNA